MSRSRTPSIERHKTALKRAVFSRPVARALDDGIISENTTVLDYGCGRGGDVKRLAKLGIPCIGFDPTFAPREALERTDVVNLGYVVNVIEDPRERQQVLRKAWELAERVLVVSARLEDEARDLKGKPWGDGIVTGSGTFQKLYTQESLRGWIETTLKDQSIAASPGIFYVFREPQAEQAFLAARVTRRSLPSVHAPETLFRHNQELLRALMDFVGQHGRLPRDGEFELETEVSEELGSLRRAFNIIKRVTGEERWDKVRLARYEDLLVYLALARFGRRPRLSELPLALQYDIKDFFGSYKAACDQADRLLFSIAESDRVVEGCLAAKVGKRTSDALYVHWSALQRMPTILRALEGCARVLTGTVDEATLIKFHLDRPRVSYLSYPGFDADPHPALESAFVVDLDRVRVRYLEYRGVTNPPILHRKELFVPSDYPLRERFSRLTRAEERAGLYKESVRIGTRNGWHEVLALRGVGIKGHRLVRLPSGRVGLLSHKEEERG
jgi:DNA phosphorothioation-associated putative methyltransferase